MHNNSTIDLVAGHSRIRPKSIFNGIPDKPGAV